MMTQSHNESLHKSQNLFEQVLSVDWVLSVSYILDWCFSPVFLRINRVLEVLGWVDPSNIPGSEQVWVLKEKNKNRLNIQQYL